MGQVLHRDQLTILTRGHSTKEFILSSPPPLVVILEPGTERIWFITLWKEEFSLLRPKMRYYPKKTTSDFQLWPAAGKSKVRAISLLGISLFRVKIPRVCIQRRVGIRWEPREWMEHGSVSECLKHRMFSPRVAWLSREYVLIRHKMQAGELGKF